jgi:hypothetical protein
MIEKSCDVSERETRRWVVDNVDGRDDQQHQETDCDGPS